MDFLLSPEFWLSIFVGSIAIPAGFYFIRFLLDWWQQTRPANQVLGNICKQSEPCKIFVRDLILADGSKVLAIEPRVGIGIVPNVQLLFAEVEGRGIAYLFNVLGQVGKTQNIELIGMGEDNRGEWNAHIILLGAQAQKHFDFYRLMKNVAYRMDGENIYNVQTGEIVKREDNFGYGIVLKAENPFRAGRDKGVALLMGGFGVLGTLAAAYYFKEHFRDLGKDFGKDYFGIVVRAPVSAGEEAVERLEKLDIRFRSGMNWRLPSLSRHGQDSRPMEQQHTEAVTSDLKIDNQSLKSTTDPYQVMGLVKPASEATRVMPIGTIAQDEDLENFISPPKSTTSSTDEKQRSFYELDEIPSHIERVYTAGSSQKPLTSASPKTESSVDKSESKSEASNVDNATTMNGEGDKPSKQNA